MEILPLPLGAGIIGIMPDNIVFYPAATEDRRRNCALFCIFPPPLHCVKTQSKNSEEFLWTSSKLTLQWGQLCFALVVGLGHTVDTSK